MMVKGILIFFCSCLLVTCEGFAGDIYWYLAASMSKPGKEVVTRFNQKSEDVRALLIIGGSGQLLSKIELARRGGIYTPASASFLKRAQAKGLVKHHRPLLHQIPVFGLSKSGQSRIRSFNDLQRPGIQLALGNPKTMALGASYLKIEKKMGPVLSDRIRLNSRLQAINISQIVNYLRADIVDAGLIFDSVARANRLEYVEIPDEYNFQNEAFLIRLIFPVPNDSEVARFENFILMQHQLFNQYGFKLNP